MNSVQFRNIDAQISEVVYQNEVFYKDDELFGEKGNRIPYRSTSISGAWQLIKTLQDNHYIDISWDPCTQDWLCRIVSTILPIIDIKSTANTVPLAICKAVLELLEKEQC